MSVATVASRALAGIEAPEVTVEVHLGPGLPAFHIVGLPDTVWFPDTALAGLPDDRLSFLLFPVERPEFFDAVVLGEEDRVLEIQVKQERAAR